VAKNVKSSATAMKKTYENVKNKEL